MLIEVEGKMNADQYCQILGDGVVESFEKLEMDEGEQWCTCRWLKGVVGRCYDKFEGFQTQPSTMTSSSESTVSQVVVV